MFLVMEEDTQKWNCWVMWQFNSEFTKDSPFYFPQEFNQTTFPLAVDKSTWTIFKVNTATEEQRNLTKLKNCR